MFIRALSSVDLYTMNLSWWHDGFHFITLVIAVIVLKNDMKWVKKWCDEHKADDKANFDRVDRDIRAMRKEHYDA